MRVFNPSKADAVRFADLPTGAKFLPFYGSGYDTFRKESEGVTWLETGFRRVAPDPEMLVIPIGA